MVINLIHRRIHFGEGQTFFKGNIWAAATFVISQNQAKKIKVRRARSRIPQRGIAQVEERALIAGRGDFACIARKSCPEQLWSATAPYKTALIAFAAMSKASIWFLSS